MTDQPMSKLPLTDHNSSIGVAM